MNLLPLLVALLSDGMGADDFRTREKATASLRSLGAAALPSLSWARGHDDPEVRHRARQLTDDYLATFRPDSKAELPWIDQLPEDYPDRHAVIDRYLAPWREAGCTNLPPDWSEYRLATARLIDDLVSAGRTRAEVVLLLNRMAAREEAYRKKHVPQ